ncbi:MAG: hypothetical protein FJ220_02750 [Kiritimatiellaceae bacterium]|nr:hypothetical protein [Kiritimatiellaceae bacterium]
MKNWINLLLLVTVAIFSLWCTGDLMRKNDQATILAGAYDLAHGRLQDPESYYQFDKTYVLYGVCAAIFKLQNLFSCEMSPIDAANRGLALVFWSALTILVVRFRTAISAVDLLCIITAPAILLNTMYVNSTVLSSAFLILSACFILHPVRRGGWLGALLFALAVGSRADVILLLPLLLWLSTPFSQIKTFPAGFSKQWTLIVAGIITLISGRIFCSDGASIDPIFNAKMVAGYVAFGFGAAGLLFSIYAIRLTLHAAKSPTWLEKLYGLAGVAAFLLPVIFFLPQLHAPRYFWRGCEAILLLAISRRLPIWTCRPGYILLTIAACLPMVLGINLSSLHRPQLTLTAPTLFPSGDGYYPMGGYAQFLLNMRNANQHPIDHNQVIWTAMQSAKLEFDNHPVLWSPMFGYFKLAASLQGDVAQLYSFSDLSNRPFYAESRSLMRKDPKTPLSSISDVLHQPSRFISPVLHGVGILQFGDGDLNWGRQTRLLNHLFSGNEYRVVTAPDMIPPNRMIWAFSENAFESAQVDPSTGLYYSNDPKSFSGVGLTFAHTVLPSWMSLGSFQGNSPQPK